MTSPIKHTLLLRLAGPLQSWGISSRWTERDTGMEPSKSGVVGILAASLGRPRDADLTDLASLVMGVRVDQEGVPAYDFQTAGGGEDDPGIAMARDDNRIITRRRRELALGILKNSARGKVSISNRHFLQDAIFLVGLEDDDLDFLTRLDSALQRPAFPIGLGRRSYVPSVPVAMPISGVREGLHLHDALKQEPLMTNLMSNRSLHRLRRSAIDGKPSCRFILEDDSGGSGTARNDQPIGAAFATRVFGPRFVTFSAWQVSLPIEEVSHVGS